MDEGDLAIKVKMLFFGPLADSMSQREIEVALLQGSTARDLIDRFRLTPMLESGPVSYTHLTLPTIYSV